MDLAVAVMGQPGHLVIGAHEGAVERAKVHSKGGAVNKGGGGHAAVGVVAVEDVSGAGAASWRLGGAMGGLAVGGVNNDVENGEEVKKTIRFTSAGDL